jgi:hypothetical protein
MRSPKFRQDLMIRSAPALAAALVLVALSGHPARSVDADTLSGLVQMLADVTLIDRECRNLETDFGPAFQTSERLGLPVADVMPGGQDRASFEAAMRDRVQTTSEDELCGAIAATYEEKLPGTIRRP